MGDQSYLHGHFEGPELAALDWVLSTRELRDAGLTQRQIGHLVRRAVLFPRFRGVFAVGRPELSHAGRCRAAWLACGPDSAVSHISAGCDWSIRQSTGRIHISVPRGRKGHDGLVVHRPRVLGPQDKKDRGTYVVTTVGRTILDMAPGHPADRVARWIHEAGVQDVIDLHEILGAIERSPRHPGRATVEAALRLHVDVTRSRLEREWLGISEEAGLPRPSCNQWLWSGAMLEEVDFWYPGLNWIVEIDGAGPHWSRWRRRKDQEKADRFRALGIEVWRVPELRLAVGRQALVADAREFGATRGPSK